MGIRRHELKRLCKNDFAYDESERFCIVVRRGKGGKMQYQRVLDEDIQFIKTYFDSENSNDRIFGEEFFKNNLNLHKLRAEAAKQYYFEQLKKTLLDLVHLHPAVGSVAVVPVGLTKHREGLTPLTPFDKDSAQAVLEGLAPDGGL